MKNNKLYCIPFLFLTFALFFSCVSGSSNGAAPLPELKDDYGITGYGFLRRMPGLWNGPVWTDTPAGSFDNWYVDFRPVSASQIGQYSTLDQDTVNFLTFFIVEYKGELRVAMRTEGVFQNKGCVTYEILDKADEEKGYYRFSDFQAGDSRAYTEFFFKGNKMTMDTYTNKFNRIPTLELHSRWKAELGDRESAAETVKHFNYPQAVAVKDFSSSFNNMSESIYYTFEYDPYPFNAQPYVGQVEVNISIDDYLTVKDNHELFLLLCTQSLFDGYNYKPENWKYFSRYIFLPPDTKSYTFKNIHPGEYFIYSYNDINGDRHHLKGDYMSSVWSHSLMVYPEKTTVVDTEINFIIP